MSREATYHQDVGLLDQMRSVKYVNSVNCQDCPYWKHTDIEQRANMTLNNICHKRYNGACKTI